MRLLATDVDGTLVVDDAVTRADAEALAAWRDAGNLLVLATGRSALAVGHAAELCLASAGVPLDHDYAVCASGTTILDGAGAIVSLRALPPDDVRAVTAMLLEHGGCALFVATTQGDTILHDPLGYLPTRGDASKFYPATLEEVLAQDVTAIPVHVPDEAEAEALAARIEAAVPGVSCPRSPTFIDVVPRGVDKAEGLRRLLAHLDAQGVQVGEVAAIGDSWNDLPMLDLADVACAVEHATEEVRQSVGRAEPDVAAFVRSLLSQRTRNC